MRKTKPDGFTLIELLIVSALIILTMFFASVKSDFNSIKLKNEANNIVSALRYTRQLNTNGEIAQKFIITVEKGEIYYAVSDMSSEAKVYLKNKMDKNIILQKKTVLDADEDGYDQGNYTKVNKESDCLFYQTRFTQNAAVGGGTIILETNKSKKIYKITIVPTSGRIYIYEIKR